VAYINRNKRNQLLESQIDANKQGMIKALKAARLRVEQRMIEAARNERFATVRRIRDGIYKDIGEEYKRLQGDLDEWSKDSILRTSKAYHALAAADLLATDGDKLASSFAQFSAKHNEEYFAKIHPFNAEKLAAVNVHLNPQLVRMAETDVRALRTATVDALREAHIAGMTPVERYKLLREKVLDIAENPASWSFIDRSGRRWKKNNYFDMLNRTVTANVARDTYHDALAEEQRDLVLLLGGTSAESHPACEKYNGKVLSLTGQTAGFPTLDEYIGEGGFHPNCVHSTAYISKEFGPHKKLIEEQGGEIEDVQDVAEFVPANDEQEAKAWAENNIAKEYNLEGLGTNKANEVNEAISSVFNKYNVKSVRAVEYMPEEMTKRTDWDASYIWQKGSDNPNANSRIVFRRSSAKKTSAQIIKEHEDFINRQKLKSIIYSDPASRKKISETLRMNVGDESGRGVFASAAHEAGHAAYFEHKTIQPSWIRQIKESGGMDDAHKVSAYAQTNPDELFAEVVTMIELDGRDAVPSNILSVFDAVIKEAGL
jgi:hypothetical protein